jgi:hypothetical protein
MIIGLTVVRLILEYQGRKMFVQKAHTKLTWVKVVLKLLYFYSFLTSTHLIGPGELVETASDPLLNEKSSYKNGLRLNHDHAQKKVNQQKIVSTMKQVVDSSLTRIQIGRFDPLATFSVMMRTNDSYSGEEYAFFQCIVRYIDINEQTLVTRVTSHRLSVASNVGEFLEAIDEEVVPVLLGKEAVYRAMFGRDADGDQKFQTAYIDELDSLAYNAQQDLDNTIYRISGAYRMLCLVQGTKRYVFIESKCFIFFKIH